MITGAIKFPLFGIRRLTISYPIQVPETFEEITRSQLLFWVEHVYQNLQQWFKTDDDKVSVIDVQEYSVVQLSMVRKLLECPSWLFGTLGNESLRDLIYTWSITGFLLNTEYTPKENPIPKIGGYVGPSRFSQLIPWEFAICDSYYQKYKKGKDQKDLDRFIAQIYRKQLPKNSDHQTFNSDRRERYNEHSDDLRLKRIEKAPFAEKLLAMYWFEKQRGQLPKWRWTAVRSRDAGPACGPARTTG